MKILESFRNGFKVIPPIAFLWNGILFIALAASAFINTEITFTAYAIMSMFAIPFMFEVLENKKFVHLWMLITLTFWIVFISVSLTVLFFLIGETAFSKFNKKFNKKFSKQ